MAKPAAFDRERFKELDDGELAVVLRDCAERLAAHRKGFGKTREAAHLKVDALRRQARVEFDTALDGLATLAASRPDLPTRLDVAGLWALAHDEKLAKAMHASIDRQRADVFAGESESDWRAERERLGGEVRALEIEIELRAEEQRAAAAASRLKTKIKELI